MLNTSKLKVRAPDSYGEACVVVDDEVLVVSSVQGVEIANWKEVQEQLSRFITRCFVISDS